MGANDHGPGEWEDVRDEWSEAIDAAFPTRSGSHDEYATAMRMVGHRHSKRALIALVNWLLVCVAGLSKRVIGESKALAPIEVPAPGGEDGPFPETTVRMKLSGAQRKYIPIDGVELQEIIKLEKQKLLVAVIATTQRDGPLSVSELEEIYEEL